MHGYISDRAIAERFYRGGLSYAQIRRESGLQYADIKQILDNYQAYYDSARRRRRDSDPTPVMDVASVDAYRCTITVGSVVRARKRTWYDTCNGYVWVTVTAKVLATYPHICITDAGSISYADLYTLNRLAAKEIKK